MQAAEDLPTTNEHILKASTQRRPYFIFKKDRVMFGVNTRTKPEETNNWNMKRLRQSIVDRIRHNVLYLSITKFRHMKIFLLRKWKFNRKAEIMGSSQ